METQPEPQPVLSPMFENPRLYLLVRSELVSLNPGKAVAQGTHAGQGFMWALLGAKYIDQQIRRPEVMDAFNEWVHSADLVRGQMVYEQGFGSTITKHATMRQIETAVAVARMAGLPAAIITDPTYPLRDGEITHLFPLNTTAYVFCGAQVGGALLGHLPLMP